MPADNVHLVSESPEYVGMPQDPDLAPGPSSSVTWKAPYIVVFGLGYLLPPVQWVLWCVLAGKKNEMPLLYRCCKIMSFVGILETVIAVVAAIISVLI